MFLSLEALHPDPYFPVYLCVLVPLRHTQLPSGSMKISESRVSDSGFYVCVASNIAGNLTQTIELRVWGKFISHGFT